MDVHLVDGTYELFRHYFAAPDAVRGVLGSLLGMIEGGATHLGVATDHVVESFGNDLYPGYRTAEGMPPGRPLQGPVCKCRRNRRETPSYRC